MVKKFLLVSISYVIRIFVTVLAGILVARVLGVYDFGVFAFYFSLATLLGLFIEFGYNLQIVSSISRANTWLEKRIILEKNFTLKHILSGAVLVISLLSITLLYQLDKISWQHAELFFALLLSNILAAYTNIYSYVYQGEEDFSTSALYSVISNFIFMIPIFVTLVWFASLLPIAYAFLIGRILSFIISTKLFLTKQKELSFHDLFSFRKLTIRGISFLDKFSYFSITFFATAYVQADTFFVKYFLGYNTVGEYQAGMRLALGFMLLVDIINSLLLPRLSRLMTENKLAELIQLCKKANFVFIFSAGILFVLNCYFASDIIRLIFGPAYANLVPLIPWFFLIVFLRFSGALYGLLVTVYQRNYSRILFLSIALLVNLILNLTLIPIYQLNGALYAAIITLLVLNFCYVAYVHTIIKSFLLNWSTIILYTFFIICFGWFFIRIF